MADSLLQDQDNNNNNDEDRATLAAKWTDKSKEDVIAAKVESDLYIKSQLARFDDLKKDYLALREETQAKDQLKDLIDRLEKPKDNNVDTSSQHQSERQDQPSFKPEDIEKLISEKMTQREQENKHSQNFNMVKAKLKEQFGENFGTTLKQRMDTLGLSQEFADDLARKHPNVFLKTFGVDEAQSRQDNSVAPPRSQQRQTSFAPNSPKRDWNYYQELKKTNPYLYLDPKIAVQMHDDAIALGKDFGMPED